MSKYDFWLKILREYACIEGDKIVAPLGNKIYFVLIDGEAESADSNLPLDFNAHYIVFLTGIYVVTIVPWESIAYIRLSPY